MGISGLPQPSSRWTRQAIFALGIAIAAFLIGYLSGNWRLDGYAALESIYVCNDDGSRTQSQVPQNSVLHICGTVSGSINWGAGMYIYHGAQVVLSRSVQISPGAFSLSVPTKSTWPIGKYRIKFTRAQKLMAEMEFELVAG